MMSPTENLYYAMGELAYAVARADGEVQKEERQKFHDIVAEELRKHHYEFDVSAIIFQVMDKEHNSSELSYKWAMKEIQQNSHYLSPGLKETFLRVMEKIALAFPPVTEDEKDLISRFTKDIGPLKGDPAYYKDQE